MQKSHSVLKLRVASRLKSWAKYLDPWGGEEKISRNYKPRDVCCVRRGGEARHCIIYVSADTGQVCSK